MAKARAFRVLVLDDDAEVLSCVRQRMQGPRTPGQLDPALPVEVVTVHIALEESKPAVWTLAASTATELVEACSKPPDLVLTDFGYADQSVIVDLRERASLDQLRPEDLQGKALTPVDLANWVRQEAPLSTAGRRIVVRNLLERAMVVYLYSYSSHELLGAIGEMSERAKKTRVAFPNATVVPLDTREELYGAAKFERRKEVHHHAYLTAVVLDHIVHKEILRSQLADARYLPIRRTAMSAAALTGIGAGIGFASQWLGALMGNLVQAEALSYAVVFGISVALTLFVLGTVSPLLFERWTRLLIKDHRSEELHEP